MPRALAVHRPFHEDGARSRYPIRIVEPGRHAVLQLTYDEARELAASLKEQLKKAKQWKEEAS